MLSDHEGILIGSLADHSGFRLLLEALQAESDDILDNIENATTDEQERRYTAEWRAYRRILTRLRNLTEHFKEALETEASLVSEIAPELFSAQAYEQGKFGKMIIGEDLNGD